MGRCHDAHGRTRPRLGEGAARGQAWVSGPASIPPEPAFLRLDQRAGAMLGWPAFRNRKGVRMRQHRGAFPASVEIHSDRAEKGRWFGPAVAGLFGIGAIAALAALVMMVS